MAKNYYDILGITKGASHDEVKKAYRKLAHEHHPDKQGGNADRFKEVNEAYSVLSDEKKRNEYDTYGRTMGDVGGGFDPNGFGFNFNGAGGQFQDFDIGDIFGQFFGGGRGGVQQKRGSDISVDVETDFAEAVFGVEKTIRINKTSLCDACRGSGGEPGTDVKTCTTCNGAGQVHETKASFLGSFSTVRECHACHGTGKIPSVKCKKCHGAGVAKKQEEIKVNIPAGINDGEMLRVTGAGEAVAGGVAGDLYIKIHIKRHATLHKEGHNLVTNLKIKLTSALLGGEQTLETLDGPLTIKIPAGITHGEVLSVKGKGVPIGTSKRGDLLIKISIEIPAKLSKSAAKLIEELKKEGI